MGRENAAWMVAALLLLLSVLMCFHLLSLWMTVSVCKDYAAGVLNRMVADPAYRITVQDTACNRLEVTLNEAVDKYLSMILSLIGGAAVSGGVATIVTTTPRRNEEDEP